MSKARLVITAVVVEGRTPAEVIAEYGVSRSWLYELLSRHKAEGDAAFAPRSKRPHSSPTAISDETVELIVALRKHLVESGLDAGPDTIAWHLAHRHQINVSLATISRTLARQGLVVPEPKKRPKSSYIRFEACVTLRVNGRLHHIGVGRTHARTHILLLVHDLEVRIIDAATGELLRELTIDPDKDYQGTGRPPGPPPGQRQK